MNAWLWRGTVAAFIGVRAVGLRPIRFVDSCSPERGSTSIFATGCRAEPFTGASFKPRSLDR
jgi:hypothetical protein